MRGNSTRSCARVSYGKLLHGCSPVALALIISTMPDPALAQLARMRAAMGIAPTIVTSPTAVAVRPVAMREALARSLEHQAQIDGIRGAVLEAQRAAIAALRSSALPTVKDGLTGTDGSNADAGLDPVRSGVLAGLDATGTNTWQGANLPTQLDNNGKPIVKIIQTGERAILSWNRFDVGANTTLNFEQKINGVAQPGWVALNRVVNSVAPSRILGSVTADGTVAVINSRGVIFEKGAQVNLHSLLVSSLEIGKMLLDNLPTDSVINNTLQGRNLTFLQSGFQSQDLINNELTGSRSFATSFTSALLRDDIILENYNDPSSNFRSLDDAVRAGLLTTPVEGDVTVEAGASISGSNGGFIILTAPALTNAGILAAPDGQVSLQAGREITAAISTGADALNIALGIGPDVRGIALRSYRGTGSTATTFGYGGTVTNSGLIDVPRGYVSLGAAEQGVITNTGLISATTSVARNAKISLTGGTINLTGNADKARASGIIVTPDTNGETVPVGTAGAPPSFKTTKIEIGNLYLARGQAVNSSGVVAPSAFGPAGVNFGANSVLLAPNADVVVGGKYVDPGSAPSLYQPPSLGSINVAAGAIIDVSGVKDLQIDPSRNSLLIDPLKRNELRDTPTYREATTNGDFTLNGATVYVDPRISGVRSDGVAWVGSPLLEAGSAASQIPVTAAELMTKGGTISMAVAVANTRSETLGGLIDVSPSIAPSINISKDAIIDFSGGWIRYADGIVRSSRLLTADGRIVDIANADPNDNFIAVGDGFTEIQSKYGISRTFANALLQGGRVEAGYDEGRDAGALTLISSKLDLSGNLFGQAFAGARQSASGIRPSKSSSIAGDARKLQATAQQLPSSGLLSISAGYDPGPNDVRLGADILVYHGERASVANANSAILLSDAALSGLGLSGLSLFSTGMVSFAADTDVRLENGAALSILSRQAITLDGKITAPSGIVTATIEPTFTSTIGSAFRTDNGIPNLYDISVNGTISTAGLWANDFGKLSGETIGFGFENGGTVNLATGGLLSGRFAPASSGSLIIDNAALIDVSAGGYVAPNGRLRLTAKGGNVSLINRTIYARSTQTLIAPGNPDQSVQSVAFTSPVGFTLDSFLSVPSDTSSEVRFSGKSLKGFGFSGGGTFTVVAPDIAMGTEVVGSAPGVGLDFLQQTGFGTLNLSANRSKIVKNLFNGVSGNSAFLETSLFGVGAGDTLDLTQWVRLPFVDPATAARLTTTATGGDISFLTPVKPTNAFDRLAATLQLGGMTELDVAAGGTITGAAGARLVVNKLNNAGMIRIAGGSITQQFTPEQAAVANRTGFGVRDAALGGQGLATVLGGATGEGPYNESALTDALIETSPGIFSRISNADVFRRNYVNQIVYFLGQLDADEGIRLQAGSVTDLSGTTVFNPRPALLPSGDAQVTGRVIAGGTIQSGSVILTAPAILSPFAPSLFVQKLNALPGATIDLRGASALFDQAVTTSTFAKVSQWSNGGRLSLLSGGTLGGSNILANGGAAQAEGGTLEWLNPIIRQTDTGVRADDVLFAGQLDSAHAGFDTIALRNGFTTDSVGGPVNLTLGKAFIITSPRITAAPGADMTVNAPFIQFRALPVTDVVSSQPRAAPTGGTGAATLTFNAGRNLDFVGQSSFVLPAASANPNVAHSAAVFTSGGDIRLIGLAVANPANITAPASLTGGISVNGDITFAAAQVYATTGTGNLQQEIERAISAPNPFAITSSASNGLIQFLAQPGATASNVYSAGSHISVRAANIVQAGVLRAPLGRIDLGSTVVDPLTGTPATQLLTLAAGSITSVAGTGQLVPYGTTTDLTEYLFSPSVPLPLTAPPVGTLALAGNSIDVAAAATVDGRGDAKGDIFAYEFVSGTGGSRDVLDRVNIDTFSGNNGLQYADGRQVYAILPKDKADQIAKYDPVYSADYNGGGGGNLYGSAAGRSIILDASPGVAAGEYILLPAHYALLPGSGALRVVENVGVAAPTPGAATTLRDGSVIVGGSYATAGTGLAESTRRSFSLQSQDVFNKSSRIELTNGTKQFVDLANKQGALPQRLAIDAARVILSPLTELKVAGLFDTSAPGGRGAQFDISGTSIRITGATGTAQNPITVTPGQLAVTTATLQQLNASSLFIGGERSENVDGTTTLGVSSRRIEVDSAVDFTTPELILAVAGAGSVLSVADGARLTGSGDNGDPRRGDYIVPFDTLTAGNPTDIGVGSVLRLSGGTERLIQRLTDPARPNTLQASTLTIGAATINGNALALDTSRNFRISNRAALGATNIALSADVLQFGAGFIDRDVEATLARATRLTLRSPDVIRFSATAPHIFNDLRLDAPGLALVAPTGTAATRPSTLAITANHLLIGNSGADLGACTTLGARACGRVGNSAIVSANDVTFLSGQFRTYGFDRAVTLNAASGMFVEGAGGFAVTSSAGSLSLNTPFLIDRTNQTDLRTNYVRPDYQILTNGAFAMTAPALAVLAPAGSEAPGTRIAIGTEDAPVASATIDGVAIRATAGIIDIRANGAINLAGNTSLATPGFAKTFGDATDAVTVSASGGTVNLVSTTGSIDAPVSTSLIVDNGTGNAGTLNLIATRGTINFAAALNPSLAANAVRAASLSLDAKTLTSGSALFDFASFIDKNGSQFGGDLAIRTATGNLVMNSGQSLRARSVMLTADDSAVGQGSITIGGTIDTSGDDVAALNPTDPRYTAARVNGGDISLFGNGGVTLASTASLRTTTVGYSALDSRVASAGDVVLGVGREGTVLDPVALTLASGSVIDASALRPGERLVSQISKNPATLSEITTYRYAEGDKGGVVSFRAPISGANQYDVRNGGTITGARSLEIEAFKRFDLQAIGASGAFTGISADGVRLNANATGAKPNFLTDIAAGTLPGFAHGFSAAAVDATNLGAFTVRPGIELNSSSHIVLDSILNLGAGKITNYAAAVAAGLLELSPLGPDASGNPRYQVVPNAPGREFENETALFNRFVDMTYRVGGSVAGAAPVVTLRANGNLDVKNSITDGFFTFHDRTNADYMSYQLGGGDRRYHPTLGLSCAGATNACTNAPLYADVVGGTYVDPVTLRSTPSLGYQVRVTIGRAGQGNDIAAFIQSPFTAAANSVGAAGTGDAFGVAELFPLVNGKAANSSSIRLVAGSAGVSVNPLHTDGTATGKISVSGDHAYSVDRVNGTIALAGDLQLKTVPGSIVTGNFGLADFFVDKFGSEAERAKDIYTIFSWGSGTVLANDARAAAGQYFAGATFIGLRGNETGVNARLEDVVAFLASPVFRGNQTFAQNVIAGTPGYESNVLARPLAGAVNLTFKTAYASTTVRTGNGDIDLAASGDVNLLKTAGIQYRSFANITGSVAGPSNAQLGSNAIYTAGTRTDPTSAAGIRPPASMQEPLEYQPYREVPNPISPGNTARVAALTAVSSTFANNGGDITITSGGDVIGRRDLWGEIYGTDWRIGQVGLITQIVSTPEYFTSGLATLAGGNIHVRARQNVSDLTIASASNVFTADYRNAGTLFALSSGNLSVDAGGDVLGGRVSLASGVGNITAGGAIATAGTVNDRNSIITVAIDKRNLLNIRLNDATLSIGARGQVDIGGVSAFGAHLANDVPTLLRAENLGFYSPVAALNIGTVDDVNITGNSTPQRSPFGSQVNADGFISSELVLPGSLNLTSIGGSLQFGRAVASNGTLIVRDAFLLYPSIYGQLNLAAAGDVNNLSLAMLDSDPADLPGAFSIYSATGLRAADLIRGTNIAFPIFGGGEAQARLDHNRRPTHLGDIQPARIYTDGSIRNAFLSLPKQARISAGGDIVDLAFRGQNLIDGDVTRITAGGDITTTRSVAVEGAARGRIFNRSNDIEVGGPGALFVEAGRDLGPFLVSGNGKSGGIRTVGNDANPWLSDQGASLYAMFGLKSPVTGAASGADYADLSDIYLNPAKLSQLDGDLFEQNADAFGNETPDRSRYVYAPILAQWLYDKERALFDQVFASPSLAGAAALAGGTTLVEATRAANDTTLGAPARTDALAKLAAVTTLANAAYPKFAELSSAFSSLGTGALGDAGRGTLRQRQFLLDKLYFGELTAPADPSGNSYLQYIRAYRAVQTLFPAAQGYTDNLATYSFNPATISADRPLGVPTKRVDAAGQPLVANRIETGNIDLRLSAIQTTRGGDITLIGPGGDIIAGSVVRLDAQLARTAQGVPAAYSPGLGSAITSFPIGNEGILTLRGGGIRSFTDGDFRLNQSRLFAVRGGDLALFSSNGDLNAGQGPRTASSFPPVTQRCDFNFLCEVDSAGSVAGAGIATFRPAPEIAASSVTLIAPVGTVDAGDAGVRASGNVFVAAARIANADNFKVGGASFGIPSLSVTSAAIPAGATNVLNANTFRPQTLADKIGDRLSQIIVNVLGYVGGVNPCPEGEVQDPTGKCLPK